jgi:uncharacterized protein
VYKKTITPCIEGNPGNSNTSSPIVSWTFLFVCFLYITWIGAWLLEQAIESQGVWLVTSGSRSIYWLLMKLLIWVLPAIIIIRLSHHTIREVMGLDRLRAILLWGGGTGLVLGMTALLTKSFGGQPLFSPSLDWPLFSGVIVAPIVEEITFRGAILGALNTRFRFWVANTITGAFFLGIHFPGWYFQGCLLANLKNPVGGALAIFLLGLLFGCVAQKSKSVVASTLCHTLNNLFNA